MYDMFVAKTSASLLLNPLILFIFLCINQGPETRDLLATCGCEGVLCSPCWEFWYN